MSMYQLYQVTMIVMAFLSLVLIGVSFMQIESPPTKFPIGSLVLAILTLMLMMLCKENGNLSSNVDLPVGEYIGLLTQTPSPVSNVEMSIIVFVGALIVAVALADFFTIFTLVCMRRKKRPE